MTQERGAHQLWHSERGKHRWMAEGAGSHLWPSSHTQSASRGRGAPWANSAEVTLGGVGSGSSPQEQRLLLTGTGRGGYLETFQCARKSHAMTSSSREYFPVGFQGLNFIKWQESETVPESPPALITPDATAAASYQSHCCDCWGHMPRSKIWVRKV